MLDPLDVDMKVSNETEAVAITAYNGTPLPVHFRKKWGACPFCARAYRYRDPV